MRRVAAVVLGGLGAWLGLSLLEPALGGGLLLSVLLEEGAKILMLSGALLLGRRGSKADSLLLGLAAIVVFAAAENMAYFLAFRSADVLERLFWSEPIHIVCGLSWALALDSLHGASQAPGAKLRKGGARVLAALGFGILALAWHLGLNLLASGPLPAPGRPGHGTAMVAAGLANGFCILFLARYFAQRVIIGGFLYGKG